MDEDTDRQLNCDNGFIHTYIHKTHFAHFPERKSHPLSFLKVVDKRDVKRLYFSQYQLLVGAVPVSPSSYYFNVPQPCVESGTHTWQLGGLGKVLCASLVLSSLTCPFPRKIIKTLDIAFRAFSTRNDTSLKNAVKKYLSQCITGETTVNHFIVITLMTNGHTTVDPIKKGGSQQLYWLCVGAARW